MITINETNIPFESKRNSACPYWYIFKHGVGPGTIPDDVKVGKVKDLDNYYSIVWLDRPLSTDELKEYDIYPETMNRQFLRNRLGYTDKEIDNLVGDTSVRQSRVDPKSIINPFDECNEDLKKEMFHHIDTGYSMVKPKYKPLNINGYTLKILETIDEVDDAFWFDEDEDGGFGGTQFFGVCALRKNDDRPDFNADNGYNYNHSDIIIFRWWFNASLVGDQTDETKIYLEVDNSLIESDLFEYEIIDDPKETNIPVEEAQEIIDNNAYEIGNFIWNTIKKNATGFGYSM